MPTMSPNASQWNTAHVRYARVCVGHVHIMLFVTISFGLGSQHKHVLLVEYGFVFATYSELFRATSASFGGGGLQIKMTLHPKPCSSLGSPQVGFSYKGRTQT